jgi:hypothetical protein
MSERENLLRRLLRLVKVVDEDEAEKADLVVCVSAEGYYFPDNVFTVCAECGGGIQHRPHVPKRPPKVCFRCARRRAEAKR